MLDEDAILRGRKKFPVRGEIQNQTPITRQENNMTIFKPLGAGSSFKCTIRYHNLKKEELGALIMAIKFPDFHSIGLGKPFGYGKVEIVFKEYDKVNDEYMNLFIKSLSTSIGNYLNQYTTILNEFKLMSKDQILINDLTYMPLRGFKEAKSNKEYLRRYSELIKRPFPLKI
jgi:CRISPR/Cas system CSM-associated protein Csm3 (group 7 of RAMP superfamily)